MQLRNGKIILQNKTKQENIKKQKEISEETIVYIVNVTQHSFFRCRMKQYKKFLKELLTRPTVCLLGKQIKSEYSHWNRNDKIVFTPPHLQLYVETMYGELHQSAF